VKYGSTLGFKKTLKQVEQAKLFSDDRYKYILSYGGSRASKTFGICRAMIIRACKTKSRHAALRLKFNHAKMSLWHETFPKVFDLCFPDLEYDENKSDYFYTLPNGSEIFVGGLDDKQRVEKILGKEFSTLFFNEVTQIPYSSVTMALTRLAEKNSLIKKAFYDCNPPTKRSWIYPLFMKGLDPDTWEPKKDADKYKYILMNPKDNLENIDDDFIEMLEQLPEKDRQRFLYGEFQDESSGQIYYSFRRENHVKKINRVESVPLTLCIDFNVNPLTCCVCQIINESINVIDEFWLENSNTKQMAEVIRSKYPGAWRIIPDATGKALKTSAAGLSDHQILRDHGFIVPSVTNPYRMDRYNAVNNIFEKNRIIIDPKCVKLIRDLEQVSYKDNTNLPDDRDKSLTHISDALGYLINYAFPLIKVKATATMFAR
jgi:PBSX family phage terminase large subunit